MSRPVILVWVAGCGLLVACSAIAKIAGAPSIKSVTVIAPAGLFVGDSAIASFNALGDDGQTHNGRPVKWLSSDPSALSINGSGRMIGLVGGRQVTITAEVDGKKGSAVVAVAADDNRLAYALADQPSAAGPYVPDASGRFNSTGGTIEVTRTSTGIYSVRFAGLGRAAGQRDNLEVSASNPTGAVYCKSRVWDASGADLRADVSCFLPPSGTPTDARFTILALGARAFGRTAPLAFALSLADTGGLLLDSSATAYNSSGGHIEVGYVATGEMAMNFKGLASAWASGPVAIQISAIGQGPRRCRVGAVDATVPGFGISCNTGGGGPGDSPWTLLWMQRGRPNSRFGFAWAQDEGSTTDHAPGAGYAINSSGGAIAIRRTAVGQYRVVFSGLARPAGGTEAVLVQSFLYVDRVCDATSWGNTGASDFAVTVSCFDPSGALSNTRFSVLVLQ
jgi:hypothetical protein